LSDRNAKTDLQTVNAQEVLARVSALPVATWRYKTADPTQRHMGPMAQDFYAAFKVGLDDKSICTVDEGGVALAAIQGLNQKVEEKDAEIEALKQSVSELKQLVQTLAAKK
jgi:cell division protein FtsB